MRSMLDGRLLYFFAVQDEQPLPRLSRTGIAAAEDSAGHLGSMDIGAIGPLTSVGLEGV